MVAEEGCEYDVVVCCDRRRPRRGPGRRRSLLATDAYVAVIELDPAAVAWAWTTELLHALERTGQPEGEDMMAADRTRAPRLPPRWFVRAFWSAHRAMYRVSGGRVGLSRPKRRGWGTVRLVTTGRRTGQQRAVIVGYFEDGPDLVTLAMNGWGEQEPAWWLNLQTHPDATVRLVNETRLVRARAAEGEERSRLWARWRDIDTDLDAYAAMRPSETAVVILEPRSVPS